LTLEADVGVEPPGGGACRVVPSVIARAAFSAVCKRAPVPARARDARDVVDAPAEGAGALARAVAPGSPGGACGGAPPGGAVACGCAGAWPLLGGGPVSVWPDVVVTCGCAVDVGPCDAG